MSGLDVELRGADQLVDSLHAGDQALDDLETADQRAGTLVAHRAYQDSPRVTGALADSVAAVATAGLVQVTAGGGLVDYAVEVEARTGFMAGAARATEDEVLAIYQQAVDDVAGTIRGA